jgi:hypothetical protein
MNSWTIGVNGIPIGWVIKTELTENVTYSQLVSKINENNGEGGLEPGKLYRITDYATTTKNGTNPDINNSGITYMASGNQFDLIVMATTSNKLDCQAKAILHSGDSYFANSDLSKWEIWYDINNDTTKYEWADYSNGKGVIYKMIDEHNNESPYDFKNIVFKRKLLYGNYDDSGVTTWVYTFGGPTDSSLSPNTYNNTIKTYINNSACCLNDIVILGNCYSNTFGSDCYYNTLGFGTHDNTFGNKCMKNGIVRSIRPAFFLCGSQKCRAF